MTSFLRNVIVAARRSDTLLEPLVPSLYADRGVRAQDAWSIEQRTDDAAPQGRGRLGMQSAPASSDGRAQPDAGAHDAHALRRESTHESDDEAAGPAMSEARGDALPDVLQPRLMQGPEHAAVPRLGPAHVAEHGARGALTIAPSGSDTADSSTATFRPRARPANERTVPATAETVEGSDRGSAARSRVQPLLREQSLVSEPPGRAASMSQHIAEVANRSGRRAADAAAPSANDVEIHIGRIEVTAAPPVIRAPHKSAPPSPSLSDYLNGRRGRRT
jgi:hypothetical protein